MSSNGTGAEGSGQNERLKGSSGLRSWGFAGLVIAQFFTCFNDNAYRWLIIPIGVELLGEKWKGAELSIGMACFVTPYVLLFGFAGYLSDRFPKRRIMSLCMLGQALILVWGVAAILLKSVVGAFATLVLMGAQGALLAPAKGGATPETIREKRVPAANGVVGLATIIAASVGTLLGPALYEITKPAGSHRWWTYTVIMIGAALLGWGGTRLVPHRPAANPKRAFQRNPFRDSMHDLKLLWDERKLFWVACASSYFWFLAGLSQTNVYLFATTQLHVSAGLVGPLLGLLALGGGLGAVLAGIVSRGRVRLGLTTLSVLGIAVSAILIYFLPERFPAHTNYIVSCVLLFLLGFASGFYDVPLQSYLQTKCRVEIRGTIIATSTSLAFLAMLIAAGAFWLMQHVFHLTGAGIFLTLGCISLPVALLLHWYFSHEQQRR